MAISTKRSGAPPYSESIGNASLLRAAAQLEEAADDEQLITRRYLTNEKDLDDFIPTNDEQNTWLQCVAPPNGEMIRPLKTSVKLLRLKQTCRGKKQTDLDHDKLREFGVEVGETLGKWNLKTTAAHADELWRLLALNLLQGSLGKHVTSVKCSTRRGANEGIYTICVYVDNGWIQRNEVMRVRQTLHILGVDGKCIQPLYWKPELYTYLFEGKTYRWIDGTDTDYWFEHWNEKALV